MSNHNLRSVSRFMICLNHEYRLIQDAELRFRTSPTEGSEKLDEARVLLHHLGSLEALAHGLYDEVRHVILSEPPPSSN